MPERLWKPREYSLCYHKSPSHLKPCLQKASVLSSQCHRVQSAAGALILAVYITNELCCEFATEPLVLRVCIPGAHLSSTCIRSLHFGQIFLHTEWLLPPKFFISVSTFIEISCSSRTKLFHAQKTSGEKPLSALERKTSQDKWSSDLGKVTFSKEHKYLSQHGVISGKSLTCPAGGVHAADWTHPHTDQRQSFQGLQQGGVYVKTVCCTASPVPCWSISLLLANAAHQNSPGKGMNFPSAFILQWATETPPMFKECRRSLHEEATCLSPSQIFWKQQHWVTTVNPGLWTQGALGIRLCCGRETKELTV